MEVAVKLSEKINSKEGGIFHPFFASRDFWLFLILAYFHNTIFWIIKFWFADIDNTYSPMVLALVFLILYIDFTSKRLKLKGEMKRGPKLIILFLFLLDLFNLIYFEINIVSGILLIISLTIFLTTVYRRIEFTRILYLFSLLILSLPILFYVNSIFGVVTRNVYAHLIYYFLHLIDNTTQLNTTIIVNGSSWINIDSGCSGIQSMYLVSAWTLFLALYSRLNLKRFLILLFCANAFYMLINTLHLGAMIYLHNFVGVPGIESPHQKFASLTAFAAFVFVTMIWKFMQKHFHSSHPVPVVIPDSDPGSRKTKVWMPQSSKTGRDYIIIFVALTILLILKTYSLYFNSYALKTIPSVEISSNCNFDIAGNSLTDEEKAVFAKSRFSQLSKYNLNFSDENGVLILGVANSNAIIADIPKIEYLRNEQVKFINNVIVGDKIIRKILMESGNNSYFWLESDGEIITEFNFVDYLQTDREYKFIYYRPLGKEKSSDENLGGLLGISRCLN